MAHNKTCKISHSQLLYWLCVQMITFWIYWIKYMDDAPTPTVPYQVSASYSCTSDLEIALASKSLFMSSIGSWKPQFLKKWHIRKRITLNKMTLFQDLLHIVSFQVSLQEPIGDIQWELAVLPVCRYLGKLLNFSKPGLCPCKEGRIIITST